MCGVNPIDHMVTSGAVPVRPLPHIPGCEICGTIEGIGKHVEADLHNGDRITAEYLMEHVICVLAALICFVETVV